MEGVIGFNAQNSRHAAVEGVIGLSAFVVTVCVCVIECVIGWSRPPAPPGNNAVNDAVNGVCLFRVED